MNIGIVLAGGIGSRFGKGTLKQYQTINDKEVIFYSIDALKKSKYIDKVVVVAQGEQIERLEITYQVEGILGGATRNKSLKNALDYIYKNYDCENVIILEAARPMVTKEIVDKYISLLSDYDSVITAQKIVSSLGSYNAQVVNRDHYYLIEAPEAFRFRKLYNSFDENSIITATNQQMPKGSKLYTNFDFTRNHKITYIDDLAYCQSLMKL